MKFSTQIIQIRPDLAQQFIACLLYTSASANEDREDACSMIRHIPLGTTHLGRIAALNQLSREICSHECSLIDAWNRLERCKNISFGKPVVHIFFCGLGCGCFSYLFGGTALDSIVGFFIGMLLQVFLFALKRHKNSKFITNILGSEMCIRDRCFTVDRARIL